MIDWLHRHFLPHESNNHQPHFLRSDNVQLLVTILLISQVFFFIFTVFIAPNSKQIAAVITSTLIEQTNSERKKVELGELTLNEKLIQSAKLKAEDMAKSNYFSHNSPDGKDPWFFFEKVGYKYQYAGENLAVNFIESKDVTDAWMNSKTHRDNILNDKFSEIGIATAQGKYKGKDAIFVVQHFGKPTKNFVAVEDIKNISNKAIESVNNIQANNVLGVNTENNINIFSKILAMTGTFNISLELAIGILSLISLLLALLIKIRIQHPVILANGVILVSITVLLAFINTVLTQGTI